MTKPTGSIRPLFYPLDQSEDLISDTPNEPTIDHITLIEWETTDPDERVNIVLNLSLNEYVALATCVDVGRDIAYGNESLYLWWIWVRTVKYMDLCALILECINTPENGIQQAILDIVGQNSAETSRDIGQEYNETSLGDGSNPTCDLDILWAQSLGLVNYLNDVNVDVFEILEVATNVYEAMAQIIGDLTLIDQSDADAFMSWITFIQESIAENYNAQITTAYLENLACEIFCVAQFQNCEITPLIMYDILSDRVSSSISITALIQNTLAFVIGGAWVGSEIADIMMLSQLAFRSQVGRIIGNVAYSDIDLRLRLFATDPDDGWTVLCDDCPPPTWTVTLVSNGDITNLQILPTDIGANSTNCATPFNDTNNRFESCYISTLPNTTEGLRVQFVLSADTVVTDIEVDFQWLSQRSPYGLFGGIDVAPQIASGSSGTFTLDLTGQTLTDGSFSIYGQTRALSAADASFVWINEIRISGEGINPFV